MKKFHALDAEPDWPQGTRHQFSGATGSGGFSSFPGRGAFALVFYKGWEKSETLKKHCDENEIDVALQLDPTLFYARNYRESGVGKEAEGAHALAAFLFVVTEELRALMDWNSHMFRRYVEQIPPKTE